MTFATAEAFNAAALAQAIYADFTSAAVGDTPEARAAFLAQLQAEMPLSLATRIANSFDLVALGTQSELGFFSGIFRDRNTGQLYFSIRGTDEGPTIDWVDDLLLTLTGTAQLQTDPLSDFIDFIVDIQGNGQFPYTGDFIFTGHSLGGHLAQYAVERFPSIVADAYTFNAAGIGGIATLSPVVRLITYLQTRDSLARNIIAEPGPELVSGPLSGMRPGNRFPSFIEDQRGRSSTGQLGTGADGNHSIALLVDAIAVYGVFELLADSAGSEGDVITGILEASSRYSLDSLEVALNQLATIVGLPLGFQATLEDRDSLHSTIASLTSILETAENFGLTSLVDFSASDLIELSREDSVRGRAARYALVNGVPFIVEGASYAGVNFDGRYEVDRFSEEYLRARADYVRALWQVSEKDLLGSNDQILLGGSLAISLTSGTFVNYDDATSGTSIQVVNPNRPQDFGQRIFGLFDAPSVITGGVNSDSLFGGIGGDVLYGGTGAAGDYLEGGVGFDIYQYNAGEGQDRIFDSDGSGEIMINGISLNGANGGTPLWDPLHASHDVWTWFSGETEFRFALVGGDLDTGGDLWIYGEGLGDGGRIIIEDWEQGELGITLTDNRPIALLPEARGQNPFSDPSFVPETETTQLGEGGGRTITLALSRAAQAGQIVRLTVSQLGNLLRLVNGAETLSFVNGELEFTLEAGQTFITVSLLAGDIDEDTSIDLTAELVPMSGTGNGPTATLEVELQGEAEVTTVPPTTFSNVFNGTEEDEDDGNNMAEFFFNYIEGGASRIDMGGGDDRVFFDGFQSPAGPTVLIGGDGFDWLQAYGAQTWVYGGNDNDFVAGSGIGLVSGGAGSDLVFGSVFPGQQIGSRLFGDVEISAEDAIIAGEAVAGLAITGDLLAGDDLNDLLVGTAARDALFGGAGADLLIGGSGDDLIGGDRNIGLTIPGSFFRDEFQWDWSTSAVEVGGVTVYGYEFTSSVRDTADDILTGLIFEFPIAGTGADTVYAGAGNDYVFTDGGDDFVDAGTGDDVVFGGSGSDTLLGGAGNDYLDGEDAGDIGGSDFLDGGDGDDRLHGALGSDVLYGGAGNDVLVGDDEDAGSGNDYLNGEAGNDILFGAAGDDTLLGGDGNDQLFGDSSTTSEEMLGDDVLDGGAGDDILVGAGGRDSLYGGAGADQLFGDASGTPENAYGDDYLDGGAGDDILVGDGGADTLLGGDGNDQLWGEIATTPESVHGADHLDGGAGDDQLVGGGSGDTLLGGEGADRLWGESSETPEALHGSDYLDGGDGDDQLVGGGAGDTLIGGAGNDTIFGDTGISGSTIQGDDHLEGGAGEDELVGEGGNDSLFGGDDNDRLFGDSSFTPVAAHGADYLDGGAGDDVLLGHGGNDVLLGGTGADVLLGGEGDDVLLGGAGEDSLAGGAGNDVLDGGEGRDLYSYALGGGEDTIADSGTGGNTLRFEFSFQNAGVTLGLGSLRISFGSSPGDAVHIEGFDPNDPLGSLSIDRFEFTDRVMTAAELLALGFDIGGTPDEDYLEGTAAADRIDALASDDILVGKGGDDVLDAGDGDDFALGGSGDDQLLGGGGADLLLGEEGDDTLDGGTGDDELVGGTGNDTYIVEAAGDIVRELASEGIDLVQSSISYTLTDNVENLTLTGGALNGTGNALANVITGNAADNVLDGAAGDDTLIGGAGNDRYIVDASGDSIVEAVNGGTDIAESSATYTLDANVENLVLTGAANIDGTGNALDNTIDGNVGNNVLDGATGTDTLRGGAGDDVYLVDGIEDVLVENAGEGTDQVRTAISYVLGNNIENLLLLGSAHVNGTGNALANTIVGNSGMNVLNGLAGADTMAGGDGDDTYVVDDAADVIIEDSLQDFDDRVEASVSYTLGAAARIETFTLTGSGAINATGNDFFTRFIGNEADNTISDLGDGNDEFYGNGGNDTLLGGADNELLDGGTGADQMAGGGGDDYYFVDNGDDLVIEAADAGRDSAVASLSYTLGANVEDLYLAIGAGNLNGSGNELANRIEGNEGDNTLSGLAGDDLIIGGAGDDTIFGGADNDSIFDFEGTNTLAGGTGDDVYYVGANTTNTIVENADEGIDLVRSIASVTLAANVENVVLENADEEYGELVDPANATGNELANNMFGSYATNVLSGLAGNDTIDGSAGNDVLLGGEGADVLRGGEDGTLSYFDEGGEIVQLLSNADRLEGGAGDDDLDGGSDDDELFGDAGNDILYGGDDGLITGPGGYGGGYGGAWLSNNDYLDGGDGDDQLDGGSGSDSLFGGAGTDVLYGGDDGAFAAIFGPGVISSDDYLDGGTGIDWMAGGTGNDLYIVDGTYVDVAIPDAVDDCGNPIVGATQRVWTTDSIVENAGEGFDIVHSSASIVLPANFEQVILLGTENLDATGSTGDEILVGNDGNNRLNGGGGADVLAGGLGNDTYVLDGIEDEVEEEENAGIDTIEASFSLTLAANFENLTLLGNAALTGTGNQANNVLRGNSGNNTLTGLEGDDELNGGAGDDELYGGAGNDVYRFGVGSGEDTVYDTDGANTVRLLGNLTGADLTLTRSGSDLILTINGSPGDRLILVGWNDVPALASGNVRFCDCGCPVNMNPPVAVNDAAGVTEDVTLTAEGSVLTNDSDADVGQTLTVTDPRTVVGLFGTLLLNANGTYTFTLDNAAIQSLAAGQTLSQGFDYTITDNHARDPRTATATLTITVTGTNDAPDANDDNNSVAEDGTLQATGNVLTNDSDVDQGTVLSVATPGTIVGTYGTLVLGSNGAYTYTLNNSSTAVQSLGQGETENEVFDYTANDDAPQPLGDGATLTIAIAGANDAPIVVTPMQDQEAQVGGLFQFTVPAGTFTDIDRNDQLSYAATLADGSVLPSWLTFDTQTRTFSGTPAAGSTGTYQVRVTATDLFAASASDVFEIVVEAAEDDTLPFEVNDHWATGSTSNSGIGIGWLMQTFGIYDGGAGFDTLVGSIEGDAILLEDETGPRPPGTSGPRLISIERIDAGDGDDVVDMTSDLYTYGDIVIEGGAGSDVLAANAGNDVLRGGAGVDYLQGNAGNDLLQGGDDTDSIDDGQGLGNDIAQGGAGADDISDQAGQNVLDGGAGDDFLANWAGASLHIGGAGTDTIWTGSGADIIACNVGDGTDYVSTSDGEQNNTLSLGGTLDYDDLYLRYDGDDLILENDAGTLRIVFEDGTGEVANLQTFTELMAAYDPLGTDPLLDNKVEVFDFIGLIGAFDAARQANPTLTRWALSNALAQFHVSGSDTAAIGGDLAYQYATAGTLATIGLAPAQDVINSAQFGVAAQQLRSPSELHVGSVRLA